MRIWHYDLALDLTKINSMLCALVLEIFSYDILSLAVFEY